MFGVDSGASDEAEAAMITPERQVKQMMQELSKMNTKELPKVPGCEALTGSGAVLHGWKEVTSEFLENFAENDEEEKEPEKMVLEGVNEEGEVMPSQADAAEDEVYHTTEKEDRNISRKEHRFFQLTVKKGEWQALAEIELPRGYPKKAPSFTLKMLQEGARKTAPSFSLTSVDPNALAVVDAARKNGEATDNALRSIEEELNTHAAAEAAAAGCPASRLLIYQLWTLKHCFAIYIDVVTGQPLHALREHRGRDRRLPFLYNPDTHSLDQRA
mmetsp:Transcript_12918/g.45372  ORF Transcript_12918/g.45372 Transcript_12918/m.45372 type:complete len:272 (+) Transcript_12918:1322-2137(+)